MKVWCISGQPTTNIKAGHVNIHNAACKDDSAPYLTPPPSPPLSSLDAVKTYCEHTNSIALLRHILRLERLHDAPELLDQAIVNVVGREWHTQDSTKLTEIDLVALSSQALKNIQHTGTDRCTENIFECAWHYHCRLTPNAHRINTRFCPGDPNKNRFGKTSFVTVEEGKAAIENAFNWSVDDSKPELGACPVIFVGHALNKDTVQLSKTFNLDPTLFKAVVKNFDTQELAQAVGVPSRGKFIGLKDLCSYHGFYA